MLAVLCILPAMSARGATEDPADIMGPYLKCRREAVARQGSGSGRPGDQRVALQSEVAACRDRFPEAAVYLNCKKKAVESVAAGGSRSTTALRDEIARCVRKGRSASVATEAAIPLFRTANGELTFAGLTLGKPVPIHQLRHPDFDCSHVDQLLNGKARAEYLGFGNHPHAFAPWKDMTTKTFEPLLIPDGRASAGKGGAKRGKAQAPAPVEYRSIRGAGRIYGWPLTARSAVLFPLGYCFATRRLDEKYREMKVYYLLDRRRQEATPYLGVAFYTPHARVPAARVESLAGKVMSDLLPVQRSPRGGKLIYASAPVGNFDEEGDPLNLCAGNRPVKYLGIAKERMADKGMVDFFLVANVGNLCQYGDSIAARTLSKMSPQDEIDGGQPASGEQPSAGGAAAVPGKGPEAGAGRGLDAPRRESQRKSTGHDSRKRRKKARDKSQGHRGTD